MTTININALIAANVAAEKKDSARYYLTSVYTHRQDGKRLYVGTDGKILARIAEKTPAADDHGESLIIASDTITALEKLAKMHDVKKKLWKRADFLTLHSEKDGDKTRWFFQFFNGQRFDFEPIDGTYPDYERVIPKTIDQSLKAVTFIADDMARLGKAYQLYTGQKNCALQLNFSGINSAPVYIETHDQNFTGVSMCARAIRDRGDVEPKQQPERKTA